jgi:hypothetical protein
MPFDVCVTTFGDQALENARRVVREVGELLAARDAEVADLRAQLAQAQAREQTFESRLATAASESSDLGNAHVAQKDKLLQLSNDGEYEQVLALLAFVEPSWKAVGYGYKAGEIRQRVRQDVKYLADQLDPRQKKERRRLEAVATRVA